MKSLYFLGAIFILAITKSNAQVIAVQQGSRNLFFYNLDSALTNAQNGDTIYIPGGSFPLSVAINKRLYIIGVGHDPDSTTATFRTVVNGQIILQNGASGGLLMGIVCPNGASPRSVQTLSNYTISRCNLGGVAFDSLATDITIRESILFGFCLNAWCGGTASISGSPLRLTLLNSILYNKISAQNAIIKNNIFLYDCCTAFCSSVGVDNSIIENNIIKCSNYLGTNNVYRNNINLGVNGLSSYGNQGSDNVIGGVPLDSIFVYYINNGEIYNSNFHLRKGSPYVKAGTDGTEVGIYGSTFPWKEGSVPENPHISSKNIDFRNDINGNIRVQIKVKAQTN
jgi:hypothetical protein